MTQQACARRSPTVPPGLALAFLCCASQAAGVEAGEHTALMRWAVVPSREVAESGVADLMAVGLLKIEGIKLVERDRIQEVMKELRLEAALDSEAVAARLQMGRLLGADALLIVSQAGVDKSRHVKVVISDCLHGAHVGCVDRGAHPHDRREYYQEGQVAPEAPE